MRKSRRFVVLPVLTAAMLVAAALPAGSTPRTAAPEVARGAPDLVLDGRLDEARAVLERASAMGDDLARRNLEAFLLATGSALSPRTGAQPTDSELMRDGRWRAFAERLASRLPEDPGVHDLGLLAAARRLAGDRPGFDAAVERLVSRALSRPTEAAAVAAVLILNDRPDLATPLLARAGHPATAFELLSGELRLSEALDLASSAASAPKPAAPSELADLAVQASRLRAGMGQLDVARDEASDIAMQGAWTGRVADVASGLRLQRQLGDAERALADAASALATLAPTENAGAVLGSLFPCRRNEAEVAWSFLRRESPGEATVTTLDRVSTLLDPRAEVPGLDELLVRAADTADTLGRCEQPTWYQGLAGLAMIHGHADLAVRVLERGAQAMDTAWSWMTLGDRLVEREEWLAAANAYERAYAKDRSAAALALRGMALERAGAEEGSQLFARALVLPLADTSARFRLAAALEQHGMLEAARQQREVLVRTGLPSDWAVQATYRRLAQLASCGGDAAESARFGELARVHAFLSGRDLAPSAARWLSRLVQSAVASADVEAGALDAALTQATTVLEPWVADVDDTASLVLALEAEARGAEADALFWRVHDRLAQALADAPGSAHLHNALAWLLVRTGRELDEALELAQGAVDLAPRSAAYLDTLAEIHFQRGEQPQAVAAGEKALALDPRRAYLVAQLGRFRAGDPAAELPPVD